MRKLSHYEQRWRESRPAVALESVEPPAPEDPTEAAPASNVPDAESSPTTEIDQPRTDDPTEDLPADDTGVETADAPRPGESRADRRKRLKRERAERRESGGGS